MYALAFGVERLILRNLVNQDGNILFMSTIGLTFVIIGAGFAGIEIAFSLRKRWPKRSIQLKVKSGMKINKKLLRNLKALNI